MTQKNLSIGLPILLVLATGIWGIRWGLPSAERTALFLRPELQTDGFYRKVEAFRSQYYESFGFNPFAAGGRIARTGKDYQQSASILSSYSSFLLRVHTSDEQGTLVMISHLKPWKGEWYPYTFAYGGGYIYPLAAYLAVLAVTGRVHLISQASYYYRYPNEIAKIYLSLRTWSIIGVIPGTIALFLLGCRLGSRRIGLWSSSLFALAPICVASAKLAKPHTWAGSWVLCAFYLGLLAKEEDRFKPLLFSAICFGMAVGTILSQLAFLPLLIWTCWTPDIQKSLRQSAAYLGTAGTVALAANFYVFAHAQDYLDEAALGRRWYPFRISFNALWEFAHVHFVSLGPFLAPLVLVGLIAALFQRKDCRLTTLAIISLLIFGFVAFEVQSQKGPPAPTRFCIALIGIFCFFAAWFTENIRGGRWLRWVCLVGLLSEAALYDLHFRSDRAPFDNASEAGLWIRDHVPRGGVIGQTQMIPHIHDFPPIDFYRYRIVPFSSPEFREAKPPVFAVTAGFIAPGGDMARARDMLLQNHFALVRRFADSPLQKLGFTDSIVDANFVVEIYQK